MVKRITKEKPIKLSKSETKADKTDKVARAIIDAEAAKRREKSERLRTRRLAQPSEKI